MIFYIQCLSLLRSTCNFTRQIDVRNQISNKNQGATFYATPDLCSSFSGFTLGVKDCEGENRLNTRT